MDGLLQMPDLYNLLSVNSWRNLVSDAIDFGSGKPDRVMGHSRGMTRLPKCTAGVPCNDEYRLLSVCVKEDHVAAFLQELEDTHLPYIRSQL
jgi:hypothetical protein